MKKLICLGLAAFLLAGFCACDWFTKEIDDVPGAIRYAVPKRIHESLPVFTFTLIGDPSADIEEWNSIRTIAIRGDGFKQRLDGFETEGPFSQENDYGLVLADFTGDGYLDIQLHKWMGGSMLNEPSIFWLWDSERREFVRNEQLEALSESAGISVEEDGRLSCHTRLGVGEYVTSYYTFTDGAFVLDDSKHVYPESEDPIEHTVTMRVHESLPEFTFTLRGYADIDDSEPDYVLAIAAIQSIDIAGEGFQQRLDGFETEFAVPEDIDDYGLAFDDFNGDGFLDLRLHIYTTTREGLSLFWLWDSEQKQFVRNEQLEELSDARHFAREEDGTRMYCFMKGFMEELEVPSYNDYYYEYIGGEFVLTEYAIMWYEDEGDVTYECIETYKLVDGRMELVSTTREEE